MCSWQSICLYTLKGCHFFQGRSSQIIFTAIWYLNHLANKVSVCLRKHVPKENAVIRPTPSLNVYMVMQPVINGTMKLSVIAEHEHVFFGLED